MALVILADKGAATTEETRSDCLCRKKRGGASRVWSSGRNRSCLVFGVFFPKRSSSLMLVFWFLERCDRYFLGYIYQRFI